MLADPELDLLRELLDEDPGARVFVDVARELVRRSDAEGALRILERGLVKDPRRVEGWRLLLDTTRATGVPGRAASVVDLVPAAVFEALGLAALRAEALRRAGRADGEDGGEGEDEIVEIHPGDDALQLIEDGSRPVSDPLVTYRRAEAYLAVGRPDRAIRIFRRLVFHHPDNDHYAVRLAELIQGDHEDLGDDDLSEELPNPALAPDLAVPRPSLARDVPDAMSAVTVAPPGDRVHADPAGIGRRPFVYGLPDEEEVDEDDPTVAYPGGVDPASGGPADGSRRRRRSLLRR